MKMRLRVALYGVFAVLLVAPAWRSNSGAARSEVLGDWGGEHIHLTVGEKNSTLEYDCAVDTVDEPLILDGNGQFQAAGDPRRGGVSETV